MTTAKAIQLRNHSSFFFGKIASRGDFVRSSPGAKVIALIDNWVTQGMELLIASPDWKNCYDSTAPIDFLFIGTRKKHAICGALIPSADASSRRFPFIAATLFEADESLAFLPLSPLVLERHTNHLRALIHHAAKAADVNDTLATLSEVPLEASFSQGRIIETYGQFLETTTIAMLEDALGICDTYATPRQMILATGYLLQPVLTNHADPPQKGLIFPLPCDPAWFALVKALWLDLVSTFVQRAEFELSVFSCMHFGTPKLILTFNGTTPTIFRALLQEQTASALLVDVSNSAWVEDCLSLDSATSKLASYLEHGNLSLRQMVETFRQAFSG
ncbi:MAG TPA: type VI secretion system-associated protein TagF [Noviherbaspirillum sp.]|uniref:type VI secretion system-associated protein TagF n=1 Tax=Noviherbaspirillum sp. TaxID=1926288 RepID=UPI002B462714|nr:type VI secretion system-associated protein TagF [Noviherbaspirillum sp.]HJV85040.1 type VI secretion system-associated protein TagF [Noviherbaspirillum sp.]